MSASTPRHREHKALKAARYHPAVYQPFSNSLPPSERSAGDPAPPQPRALHLRSFSEAQRQLIERHRELLFQSDALYYKSPNSRPKTPDLIPAGSPGEVMTPLALGEVENAIPGGDYFQVRKPSADDQDYSQCSIAKDEEKPPSSPRQPLGTPAKPDRIVTAQ